MSFAEQRLRKFQGKHFLSNAWWSQEKICPPDSPAAHSPAESLDKLIMSLYPVPHQVSQQSLIVSDT